MRNILALVLFFYFSKAFSFELCRNARPACEKFRISTDNLKCKDDTRFKDFGRFCTDAAFPICPKGSMFLRVDVIYRTIGDKPFSGSVSVPYAGSFGGDLIKAVSTLQTNEFNRPSIGLSGERFDSEVWKWAKIDPAALKDVGPYCVSIEKAAFSLNSYSIKFVSVPTCPVGYTIDRRSGTECYKDGEWRFIPPISSNSSSPKNTKTPAAAQ